MIQMKLWAIATLMSCASVFTACTTNDNPVTPQEKPLPKVSTIYTASTVKAENNTAEVKEMRITTHAVYDLEYAE